MLIETVATTTRSMSYLMLMPYTNEILNYNSNLSLQQGQAICYLCHKLDPGKFKARPRGR